VALRFKLNSKRKNLISLIFLLFPRLIPKFQGVTVKDEHNAKPAIKIVAIDLAKNSFHVHGADDQGRKVMSKKMSRSKLAKFMANLPPCLVAMEACGSAHYWGRKFQSYGHEVRLIAPQFVKPFVKSNKNDAVDAEAICEAVQRPGMRFVAIKSVEQQDVQSVHRIRSQLIKQRTALVNQIRGLLLERGIVIPCGRANVLNRLPEILEDAENELSGRFRLLLNGLKDELRAIDERIAIYDQEINQIAQHSEAAKQLMSIPGIGALSATALLAHIGDVRLFKNGRELAAFLGLVPRQRSTGGKPTLLGISKRGDVYIRTLLIHGARAVLRFADKKQDRTSRWVCDLMNRRGKNVAAVALAKKMARTVFALLRQGERYAIAAVAEPM
jgi:transposase